MKDIWDGATNSVPYNPNPLPLEQAVQRMIDAKISQMDAAGERIKRGDYDDIFAYAIVRTMEKP